MQTIIRSDVRGGRGRGVGRDGAHPHRGDVRDDLLDHRGVGQVRGVTDGRRTDHRQPLHPAEPLYFLIGAGITGAAIIQDAAGGFATISLCVS